MSFLSRIVLHKILQSGKSETEQKKNRYWFILGMKVTSFTCTMALSELNEYCFQTAKKLQKRY